MDSTVIKKHKWHEPHIENGEVSNEAWEQYSAQIFSNLFARTDLIYEPREIAPRPAPPRRGGRRSRSSVKPSVDPDIRIACISSPIDIGDIGEKGKFELRVRQYRDGCRLIQATSPTVPVRWEAERLAELKAALRQKPHFIIFGEFAYPPSYRPPAPGWTIDDIRRFEDRRLDFERRILAEVDKVDPKPFVFLGSYHCLMTLYNVGILYPWGSSTAEHFGNVLRPPTTAKGKPKISKTRISAPVFYRKRFPARRAGEDTRVPTSRIFDIFRYPFGRVAVAICSDMVDLNQFMNIARFNLANQAQGIDILLVPSFNRSPHFPSMCRELSYLAGVIVVVVNANANLGNQKYPTTDIYANGLAFADFGILEKELGVPLSAGAPNIDPVPHERRNSEIRTFTLKRAGVNALRHKITGRQIKGGTPGNFTQRSL